MKQLILAHTVLFSATAVTNEIKRSEIQNNSEIENPNSEIKIRNGAGNMLLNKSRNNIIFNR